jgi:hypothetical protein
VYILDREQIPCCAADALWRVRKVKVNGVMTGINRLDESIAAVRAQNPAGESAIRALLLEKVRASNYIPPGVVDAYGDALLEEYRKVTETRCGYHGCGGGGP